MASKSLFNFMDKTKTGYGRRLLKKWLENPLRDISEINERLDGIEDFCKNITIADYFHSEIGKLPDFERALGRIYNGTNIKKLSHSKFDNFASNNLKEFFKLLIYFEKITEIIETFDDYKRKFKSKRLKRLVTFNLEKNANLQGLFPYILSLKSEIEKMVEYNNDVVVPKPGVYEKYDEILKKINSIKNNLNEIITQLKKKIRCEEISYSHNKLRRYEIEIPELLKSRIPEEFNLTSKRQGY